MSTGRRPNQRHSRRGVRRVWTACGQEEQDLYLLRKPQPAVISEALISKTMHLFADNFHCAYLDSTTIASSYGHQTAVCNRLASKHAGIGRQAPNNKGCNMPRPHALPTAETALKPLTAHKAPSTTWQVIPQLFFRGMSGRRYHGVCTARVSKWIKRRGMGVAAACRTETTVALTG